MPSPVIMVHGSFCGGWAFERFREPFEAAGHTCIAPDLPGHGPGESVVGKSMDDYASAIVKLIEACEAPPILIGHSLGGLVAQLAAARAPVASLILLSPSAPWGSTSMEAAAAAFGLMGLGAFWAQGVEPDRTLAHTFGFDGMAEADRTATFDRMTAESGRALGETFHWWLDPFMTTRVDASRITAPVLTAAGGRDGVHAPSSVRQTAERLGGQFRLYPQMGHWLIGEPGWETVAADCLSWIAGGFRAAA